MEAKIILSLSNFREGSRSYQYKCPGNTVQKGSQTNEAPVKYLLKKDPSVRQILCLVTPSARKTALEHFRQEISKVAPRVHIQIIETPDTGKLPEQTIAELTRQLDPGDSVYLDSSGGSRYAIMGLLQLARILEFKGVKLRQVVYANLSTGQGPTIDDVTDLYTSMDLIGGMQELADFGSVNGLRRYFRRDTSADAAVIVGLLDSIELMTDAITLCRPGVLKSATTAYREAMARTGTIRDPVMLELIGILRRKFGEEISTPWLISWCLDHRMLTQALSLYREWMPEFILHSSGLFTSVPELPARWKTNKYQDHNVFVWEWMMNLALPEDSAYLDMYFTIDTIEKLDRLLPDNGFAATDIRRLKQVAWDFQYIQCMRNMVLHGNEEAAMDKRLRKRLQQEGYDTDFAGMSATDMLKHIRRALNRVEAK